MKEQIRTLECADCHVKIEAEVSHAYNVMRLHVKERHGRDIAFKRDDYERLTRRTKLYSTLILNPDLTAAA